jgi:hypothetical protein
MKVFPGFDAIHPGGKQGKLQISGHAVSKRHIAESSADRMVLFTGVSFHPLQQKSALTSRSGIEEKGSKKNFLCVETVATAAALHLEPGSKCRSRRCLSHPNTDYTGLINTSRPGEV